jgi:hypothetical protein
VHVRPLRQPHATGETSPAAFHTPNPQEGYSSLPIIGRRLPSSSSFVLRPRLPARRCGRSSLTPDRAAAQTGSDEESHNHSPTHSPASGEQVTGSNQHGLLTAGTPMGADMWVMV